MSDLDRLFYWRGITSGYLNYRGEHVQVPIENRINLLKAMGVDVSSPEAISLEAYLLDVEPWKHWLAQLSMTPAGKHAGFEINIHPDQMREALNWELFNDNDQSIGRGSFCPKEQEETGEYLFDDIRFSRRKVNVGELEPNYYRLKVHSTEHLEWSTLVAYPQTSYQNGWADSGEKLWGVTIQLYTLKSERNWGIGDFTDLRELIEQLAKHGADAIGLNPLHTLSPNLEEYFSPYNPSDRRYINPLYIDPCFEPEFVGVKSYLDEACLQQLRNQTNVDYFKARALKYPILQGMFELFLEQELAKKSDRFYQFKRFVENESPSIVKFAYFEASHQSWPGARFVLSHSEQCADLGDNLFAADRASNETRQALLFHCYLQWLAAEQLEVCQRHAKAAGMKLGLVRDLAVGADGSGAEVSTNLNLFCRESAIGAPPDPFAHTGQNWGLPPAIPSEMQRSGFKHFMELLRTNMSHCGALRIDHAMSLMRLWWCPPGKTADHGAYVYYPFYELLGILILESHLNKCSIIGEDLGVVPNEFRDAMARVKIFTNKVFYFEKVFHDKFKRPEDYDPHSLAMVTSHDVPTLVSWWNRTDLTLRNKLNLLEEGVSYTDICEQRQRDKQHLLALLCDCELCPQHWRHYPVDQPMDQSLVEAILVLASRTASKIFVIQLEDLLMMDHPVNVPGTFKEHNNWQRKLTASISEIFSERRINKILKKINEQRKK